MNVPSEEAIPGSLWIPKVVGIHTGHSKAPKSQVG